jgi:methionyl-tRNA formyltransferase
MGTPDFAVPAFENVINSDTHKIVSAFTTIPKAKGRGLKESLSPIHKLALERNIPVFTPTTLRTPEVTNLINSIDADLIVVVAYGFIIPKEILNSKKYGCLNIHPSDLPEYRGAAPMQRTIINGDNETAIAIIQMDEGLDTGPILLKQKLILPPRITLPILHDKCSEIGADLLIKALDQIDILPRVPQFKEGASYAHKLSKEEGKINWHEEVYKIDCKIRGMNRWPGVYFEYKGKIIKILEANYKNIDHSLAPGTIINNELAIACGKGVLIVKKLQQAGRAGLITEEFLRGVPLIPGTCL